MDAPIVVRGICSAESGRVRLPGNGQAVPEKNELKPWRIERYCIPEADHARTLRAALPHDD